jgi:hypothetical protein
MLPKQAPMFQQLPITSQAGTLGKLGKANSLGKLLTKPDGKGVAYHGSI